MPGASPSNMNTHTGFSRGSTAPSSEHASGGQEPDARPSSTYGMPSCTTPRINMQMTGAAPSSGGSSAMNGMLTQKVSPCAMSIALMRSLSLAPSRLI